MFESSWRNSVCFRRSFGNPRADYLCCQGTMLNLNRITLFDIGLPAQD